MKVRIKTAHGYLSAQPGNPVRFEYRETPGAWEQFDVEGWDLPVPPQPTPGPTPPQPTPPPDSGYWLGIPPSQTASYVSQVKAYLQSQGIDLNGPCGAFAIVENVAWGLRGQGFGYLEKTSGNNCQGYATDIVMQNNGSGDIVDILGDGGNQNIPQWTISDTVDPARWRPPVQP